MKIIQTLEVELKAYFKIIIKENQKPILRKL